MPSQNMNFKITYKRKKVLDELKYWYYLLEIKINAASCKTIKSRYVIKYKIVVMIKKTTTLKQNQIV